ncbi:MAG: hypothetical protein WC505_05590 [Patescibacteria group bacterium]
MENIRRLHPSWSDDKISDLIAHVKTQWPHLDAAAVDKRAEEIAAIIPEQQPKLSQKDLEWGKKVLEAIVARDRT